MEDFCQLGKFQTEQKYDSSYERCGKLIIEYCTSAGLDTIYYFELLLFSFLSGNNDMHMKNFSVLHVENEIILSPAYDLINSKLVNDKDDMALLLNGKKKNIKLNDFERLAIVLNIREKLFKGLIKKFTSKNNEVFDLIDRSFLTADYKDLYKKIWMDQATKLLL